MKRDAFIEWVGRSHRPSAATRRTLERALDELVRPIDARFAEQQRFEAALNDQHLFEIVKLIHVCEPFGEPIVPWATGRYDQRAGVLFRLMAIANETGGRFDEGTAVGLFEAMGKASLTSWYPTIGFEVRASDGAVTEMSVYSEHRPVEAGAALVRRFGLGEPPYPLDALHAVGVDFFASGTHRLKFYFKLPSAAADDLSVDVSPGFWPTDVLVLVRAECGVYGSDRKAYVTMIEAPQGRMTVDALDGHVSGGRLRKLVDAVLPETRGCWLSFVSASDGKAEIYFGGD